MVNATQMARPFERRPAKWLELSSTKDFIDQLTAIRKTDRLVETINGVGTWMHEDVAMEFARWLSPTFAIWCNDRIKELLTQGVTTVSDDDAVIAQAMDVLQRRLDASRQRAEALEAQNRLQAKELQESAPKVEYVDEVLQSVHTYTSTQMAKELDLRTADQLHRLLKSRRIMMNQSGQWMLTAKYCGKGYTKGRTHTFTRSDGTTGTNTITVWTERGRNFLHLSLNAMAEKGGAR